MSTSRDKLIEAAKKLDRQSQIDGDAYYFKKVNEVKVEIGARSYLI